MAATPLIGTLVTAFLLAFVFATIAHRFRISPIIGYVIAGIAVGPFTPGYVADQGIASELADIGVVLLMFGVGLHFSVKELLAVRGLVLPGALTEVLVMTSLGAGLGTWLGWPIGAAILFGLALSVASTVVVLRTLEERRFLNSDRGRAAVGWLVVEDGVMVLALVLVPALAPLGNGTALDPWALAGAVGLTIAKVVGFVVVMLVAGRRLIPALLHYVAHTGSRELFRLAVLALSLGTAFGASQIFGVSFALGAFFAGLVLAESTLSQQAARETLPLRDAFAVLFFVSVGMLFNPMVLVHHPLPVAATVVIIVFGKSLAAFGITRIFGAPMPTARLMSASLAQIGELSFILAGLGMSLHILPPEARDYILAGSILSILVNPVLFALLARIESREHAKQTPVAEVVAATAHAPAAALAPPKPVVLVGFGRVGRVIHEALRKRKIPAVVIEIEDVEMPPAAPSRFIAGNAANPDILGLADLAHSELLFLAIPDGFEAGQIAQQARAINPALKIVARVHTAEEAQHLRNLGADLIIAGEEELARGMVAAAFGGPPG